MKAFFLIFIFLSVSLADLKRESTSALNSDPNVVYTEEITAQTLKFEIIEERPVYLTRHGKQRVGTSKVGTVCELIGFDNRAFKIKGEAKHSRITGWISPHALQCKDPNFIENFKKLYERKKLVKELIANEEIAIGMTPIEVVQVMGKPTKTSVRTTVKGTSGLYEYIEKVEKKHYKTIQDYDTGQFLKSYSHSTEETKSRVGVEFVDNTVSAIEKDEDNSVTGRALKIVAIPVFVDWSHYVIN